MTSASADQQQQAVGTNGDNVAVRCGSKDSADREDSAQPDPAAASHRNSENTRSTSRHCRRFAETTQRPLAAPNPSPWQNDQGRTSSRSEDTSRRHHGSQLATKPWTMWRHDQRDAARGGSAVIVQRGDDRCRPAYANAGEPNAPLARRCLCLRACARMTGSGWPAKKESAVMQRLYASTSTVILRSQHHCDDVFLVKFRAFPERRTREL